MLDLNFTIFPVLETTRLFLRQLEITDEEDILLIRSDYRVNEFLDRPKATTKEEARQFIDKINKGIAENKSIYWAITEKGRHRLIGTICLWNFRKENDMAETGYELKPHFQGKGIMQEALARVIEFGFMDLKLRAIDAYSHHDNSSSIRLLEKFNFKKVGVAENNSGNKEIIYVLDNP